MNSKARDSIVDAVNDILVEATLVGPLSTTNKRCVYAGTRIAWAIADVLVNEQGYSAERALEVMRRVTARLCDNMECE